MKLITQSAWSNCMTGRKLNIYMGIILDSGYAVLFSDRPDNMSHITATYKAGIVRSWGSIQGRLTGGRNAATTQYTIYMDDVDGEWQKITARMDLEGGKVYIFCQADGDTSDSYTALFSGTIDSVQDDRIIISRPLADLDRQFRRWRQFDYGAPGSEAIPIPFGVFTASYYVRQISYSASDPRVKITASATAGSHPLEGRYIFTWNASGYFDCTDPGGVDIGDCYEGVAFTPTWSGTTNTYISVTATVETAGSGSLSVGDTFIIDVSREPRGRGVRIDSFEDDNIEAGSVWGLAPCEIGSVTEVWCDGVQVAGGKYTTSLNGNYAGKAAAYVSIPAFWHIGPTQTVQTADLRYSVDFGGAYSGSGPSGTLDYVAVSVKISDAVSSPQKFQWNIDNGAWSSNISINKGTWHDLVDGIQVRFRHSTTYTLDDQWAVKITRKTPERMRYRGTGIQLSGATATNPVDIMQAVMSMDIDAVGTADTSWIDATSWAQARAYLDGKGITFAGELPARDMSYVDIAEELTQNICDIDLTSGYMRIIPIRSEALDGTVPMRIHYRDTIAKITGGKRQRKEIQNVIELKWGAGFIGEASGVWSEKDIHSILRYGQRRGSYIWEPVGIECKYCADADSAQAVASLILAARKWASWEFNVILRGPEYIFAELGDRVWGVTTRYTPHGSTMDIGWYRQPVRITGYNVNLDDYTVALTVMVRADDWIEISGGSLVPDSDEYLKFDTGGHTLDGTQVFGA